MSARHARRAPVAIGVLFLVFALTACSSSPAASSGASGVTATPSAPVSTAPQPSAAEPSTAGGGAPDACALLSAQDVQTALGVAGLTAKPFPGATTSHCSYQTADGKTVAATSYAPDSPGFVDTYKTVEGAILIPGVGDGAVLVGPILYVQKGNAMFGFQLVNTENMSADQIKGIAAAIGAAVSAHL